MQMPSKNLWKKSQNYEDEVSKNHSKKILIKIFMQ